MKPHLYSLILPNSNIETSFFRNRLDMLGKDAISKMDVSETATTLRIDEGKSVC